MVQDICFETLLPEPILQIPSKLKSAKTDVDFGIRITNNTDNPRRFLLFFVRPKVLL
ncbi:MAG: hypothetical protein VKL59_16100 [Nostocaceae cyanobacterium]|nr:hypothetical protein [Nostocaceae cyanobacterium]